MTPHAPQMMFTPPGARRASKKSIPSSRNTDKRGREMTKDSKLKQKKANAGNSTGISKRGAHLKAFCFKPGQSGNPSGRRKDRTVKMLAREYTVEAIETLARILKDEKATPAAQVAAATALLDRGWGRPVQQLEVGEAGAFSEMSDDDLDAFIASAVDRMAALGGDSKGVH